MYKVFICSKFVFSKPNFPFSNLLGHKQSECEIKMCFKKISLCGALVILDYIKKLVEKTMPLAV